MKRLDDVIERGGTFIADDGQRIHVMEPIDIALAIMLANEQGGVWTSSSGVETRIAREP